MIINIILYLLPFKLNYWTYLKNIYTYLNYDKSIRYEDYFFSEEKNGIGKEYEFNGKLRFEGEFLGIVKI